MKNKTKINGFQRKTIARALKQVERLSSWDIDFCKTIEKGGSQYMVSDDQNIYINQIGGKLR